MIQLYEDQQEALNSVRSLWRAHRRIVLMAPTGSGKTFMASEIIKGCVKNGWRVCFLVPRVSLLEQTARSFLRFGIDGITYLWGSYDTDEFAAVTIASVDTYIRRDKGNFDLVIVDEVHHRRRQLLEWMDDHPDDRYLGLSATPFAPWIGSYYTALAKAKPMRWLIDNDRLAEYSVFAPETPDMSGAKTVSTPSGKDYRESDLEEIMGDAKVVGNVVQNWLQHGENRRTMALCVNVSHANHLTLSFQRAGVSAEVVTASTPVDERERIFDRVRDGRTTVLLSVNALTEGFDVPEISCIINARPTKSLMRYVQGMGRGLRKKPAHIPHKDCIIFDHSGTTLDLGFPCQIDIDELPSESDGMEENASDLDEDKEEKKPKMCSQCKFLKDAGVYVCPQCGFKPISGENVEADESRGLRKIKGKDKVVTMEDKQKFYSELLGYQRERAAQGRPVSDGYIAHTYKDKFGVWPRSLSKYPLVPSPATRGYIRHKNIKFAKSRVKS